MAARLPDSTWWIFKLIFMSFHPKAGVKVRRIRYKWNIVVYIWRPNAEQLAVVSRHVSQGGFSSMPANEGTAQASG
jgi:hypothetical protein